MPHESLADRFINYVRLNSSAGRKYAVGMMSARDLLQVPENQRDIVWLSQCIQKSPAYKIDRDVLDMGEKFLQTYISGDEDKYDQFAAMLINNPQVYSIPFPAMWIEYEHTKALSANPTEGPIETKIGMLLENLPSGKGIKGTPIMWASNAGFFPSAWAPAGVPTFECEMPRCAVHMNGYVLGTQLGIFSHDYFKALHEIMKHNLFISITMMTILKSRTPILKLIKPAPLDLSNKLKRKISKGNASAPKQIGTLTFDIARCLQKGHAANEEDAKRFMAEQMVMGHFKLRNLLKRDEKGVPFPNHATEARLVWHNPHWRGGTEEQKLARVGRPVIKERKAEVVDSKPDRPKVIPFLQVTEGYHS